LDLKRTHIFEFHNEHGKVVDFGGFAMPVWYDGIKTEHDSVREGCGLFDTSHMGRTRITGEDTEKFLNYLVTNNVTKLKPYGGLYTVMCTPKGGIVDDLILYKFTPEDYLFVYNAGNRDKDFNWLKKNSKGFKVNLENLSDSMAMIAVQGPKGQETLQKLTDKNLDEVERFNITELKVNGYDMYAARTGYTGEDGFELYIPDCPVTEPVKALKVWNDLVENGAVPCGLGARDSLRRGNQEDSHRHHA